MDEEKIGKILLIFGFLMLILWFIIESFKISISFGIFMIGLICFTLGGLLY